MELPITIPAIAEKSYDEWFYTQFFCENLHDYENGVVSFVRMPRNSTTKEILDSHAERITRKFWPFMTQGHPDYNQSIANAMQSMLDVLPLIQNNDSMTDH